MTAPSPTGLDQSTRQAEYRLEWETTTDTGAYYGDDPETLADLAEHLRTEHGAWVQVRGFDEYTQGYNKGVAE